MRRGVLGVLVAVLGSLPDQALACATCAVSAYGDRTFNWAYLSLLVTPFLVAGVIGGIIFHVYRRKHEPGR